MGGIRLKCEDCKGLGFLVEAKPVEPKVTTEYIDIEKMPTVIVTDKIKPNSKKVKVTSVKVEQPI